MNKTVAEMREETAREAMWRLVNRVIPQLEGVIAGTPTGPARERLTEANIILNAVVAGQLASVLDDGGDVVIELPGH